MTTSALTSADQIHLTRRSASRRGVTSAIKGKQTFARSLRSEWLKLVSLRSTWVTSAITVAVMVLFGASTAVGYHGVAEKADEAKYEITSGAPFGYIVVAVLAALLVTSEYASGQIRSTLTATPHRGRVLMAKAAVVAVFGFALGAVSTMATWAATLPFLKGDAGSLTSSGYLGFFWGSGLTFAAIALMGLAYGFLLRSTAGAITTVVVILFVIMVPVQIMAAQWDWATELAGLLPTSADAAITDPFALASTWGVSGTATFLSQAQTALVFLAWTVLPLPIAAAVFCKRDA
ncbi:ABC transporter component [Actinomyces sp. Chiba101]|nr:MULTISPECIES: ABC transporter permease subunit [Actinomyces]BAW93960.1 ABC transporter component [Actinomyces sp. Chiba101]GAV93336.1 ABC transporter related protein [Actinomyces denticolens]SUU74460.1 ABC-type transport system involved in multi-copper enzyme maturation, permease component [Actinomyces denticolens]